MTIFTTFNKDIYDFSGKHLIESIKNHAPTTKIIAYKEFDEDINVESVDIRAIPALQQVINDNLDIIHESFGGHATEFNKEAFWNTRWPGWFRKVVMAHHAIYNNQHENYLIFVDSDIRFKKQITTDVLRDLMNDKPIGIIQGYRPQVESGIIVLDAQHNASRKFYTYFMNCFLSGNFRSYKRWDDIYVMTKIINSCPPAWFHDFAKNQQPQKHTNSNGHTTNNQIIPFSELQQYIEHDKGIHVRNNIQ